MVRNTGHPSCGVSVGGVIRESSHIPTIMNLRSRSVLAALAALLTATAASAGTVGGSVTAINTLTENFVSNITIGTSTPGNNNAQTDTTIVSGQIDNNNDAGWKLTIVSANAGKLMKGAGGAGRQITYTNVKFVRTSGAGTLGAGLTDPHDTVRNIATGANAGDVAGTTVFNTGSAYGVPGTATDATEAYTYALRISWSSDTSLLAGTYSDTITLTLANDS